jgi:hypothetical protein
MTQPPLDLHLNFTPGDCRAPIHDVDRAAGNFIVGVLLIKGFRTSNSWARPHGTEGWRSALSDISLRRDVMDELEFEPSLDATHIGVIVENDIVTLTDMLRLTCKS